MVIGAYLFLALTSSVDVLVEALCKLVFAEKLTVSICINNVYSVDK